MEVDDEVVLPATEQEAEDYYYRVEAAGEDKEEAMTTTTTTTTTTTVTTTNKTRAPLAPGSPDPHVTAKTISYSPLGMALARPSASVLGVESFLGDSDSIFHYHRPTVLSAALEPRMSRDVERIRTLTRALGARRMTHSGQPGGSSEHELRQAALERVVRKLTLTMRSDTFGRQAISEQYRMALDSRRQARRARVAGARDPPHSSPQQAVTARITEDAEDDEWESADDSDADAQNDDDALTRDALALVRRVHQRAERRRARGGGVSKATGGSSGVGKAAGARGKAPATAGGGGGVTAAYARMLTDEQATRRMVSELGQGDTDAVLRLLRAGVSVNTRDSVGRTPLHVACACANHEAVQLLLRMGADANAVDRVGNTPLTIAATSAQVDLVVPLLEAGADPKIGKGLVSAMAMVRSRLRLLRAHIRHARAAEKTAAAPTAARARRLHAVAVARQCVDIIHLLRLHSADTPASAPATSSSAAATNSNTRPDAAAAELDDLSAQLMSMGLSANANADKGKQSAERSGTGAGYSSDDEDQFDDMLVRFSQLLGDSEADANAVLNGSAP